MRDYKKSSVYMKPGDKRRMKEHRAHKRMRRYLRRKREREVWWFHVCLKIMFQPRF